MSEINSNTLDFDVYKAWAQCRDQLGEKPAYITAKDEAHFRKIFFWNSEDNLETTNLPILELLNNDRYFWRYAVTLALQDGKQWYEPVLELMFQCSDADALQEISRNILNWSVNVMSYSTNRHSEQVVSSYMRAENFKDIATAIIALSDGDIERYLSLTERFAVGNKIRVISVIFDVYYSILEKYDARRAALQMAKKFEQAPDYYYMKFRQLFYEVKTLSANDYCKSLRLSIEKFEKPGSHFYVDTWQELYTLSPDFMASVQNDWRTAVDHDNLRWRGYKEFLSAIVSNPTDTYEIKDLMLQTDWLDSNDLHEDLKFFAQDSDNRLYGTLCRFAQIRALRLIVQNLNREIIDLDTLFSSQEVNWCPIHESSNLELKAFVRSFLTKGSDSKGQIQLNRLGLQAMQLIGRESKPFQLSEKALNFVTRGGKWPLLEWQEAALKSWASHGRQGLVAAATGTGKSRLGTAAILEAYEDGLPVVLLSHRLAIKGQWKKDELAALDTRDIHGFEVPKEMRFFELGKNVQELSCEDHYNVVNPPKAKPFSVLIALDKSLANRKHLLPSQQEPGLLVADEVHQFNDPTGKVILEGNFDRRIGLSATISGYDDYGLLGYFGGSKVVDYPIYKATRDKIISEYNLLTIRTTYTPVAGFGGNSQFVDLDKEGKPEVTWKDLEMADRNVQSAYDLLLNSEHFLLDQSHDFEAQVEEIILRKDTNLLDLARRYIREKKAYESVLRKFQIEADPLELLARKIEAVGKTLIFSNSKVQGKYYRDTLTKRGLSVGYIDSDTEQLQRGNLFGELQENRIKALISPQILDEGVNLPNARIGLFLGNGTNVGSSYRQTIQRMGRVLRKKENSERALLILVVGKRTREDPGAQGENSYLDNQFAVMSKHAANKARSAIVDFEDTSGIYSLLDEYLG